jgi:hypothetical protein
VAQEKSASPTTFVYSPQNAAQSSSSTPQAWSTVGGKPLSGKGGNPWGTEKRKSHLFPFLLCLHIWDLDADID